MNSCNHLKILTPFFSHLDQLTLADLSESANIWYPQIAHPPWTIPSDFILFKVRDMVGIEFKSSTFWRRRTHAVVIRILLLEDQVNAQSWCCDVGAGP